MDDPFEFKDDGDRIFILTDEKLERRRVRQEQGGGFYDPLPITSDECCITVRITGQRTTALHRPVHIRIDEMKIRPKRRHK